MVGTDLPSSLVHSLYLLHYPAKILRKFFRPLRVDVHVFYRFCRVGRHFRPRGFQVLSVAIKLP